MADETRWGKFTRCWHLFRDSAAFAHFDAWHERIPRIEALLTSPEGKAVAFAVAKVSADKSFHRSKDHEKKRSEALEWAHHWADERRITLRAWECNFILEWLVGQGKWRL